ncbi:MAG: DUF4388 domain-containing protein [Candidatus Krumholzibacteriota bacterium]|nr:DUF4388 domain-containing protein [Candidatus Krumholzibacteriota bacterium]
MTIQSSIKELGLFDLFQLLHLNAKTGRLIISDAAENREAQILFQEGSVCLASMHDRSPKTTEMLLEEWGVIDQATLPAITNASKNYNNMIDCLAGEGISSKPHLESFFGSRIRENIYDIFKWENGDCRFIEEELDKRREVLVLLNTENLILEGARRIDEWSNIKAKVPSRHSVFHLCPGNEKDQRLNLKPKEWEILSLVDGVRSVNEVNNLVGEDLFTTSKLIYGLVVMNVIELEESQADDQAGAKNEEKLDELVRRGKEHYSRLNLEMAAGEFEKALQIDPDCFDALRMLGEIYYKMERLSESLVYLRKARTLRPQNQKTMFIKGYLHARLGEVDLAVNEWEELREKARNPKIIDIVKHRIQVAREWEKVLQEY